MTLIRWFSTISVMFLSAAAPSLGDTLPEAVTSMLKFEPELLSVDLDSLATYEDFNIARSKSRPRVSFFSDNGYAQRDRDVDALVRNSSGGGGLHSRQVGLSIKQLLYDGGKVSGRSVSTKEAYRAQRLLQMGVIEDRVVDLTEVYMEILRLKDQIRVGREYVSFHREFLKKLVRREQLGGSRSDSMLTDGRLSLAESELTEIEANMEVAVSRYRRLTGCLPRSPVHPKLPCLHDISKQAGPCGNWQYLAACATLKSTKAELESILATHRPDIYLDAGAMEGRDTSGVKGSDLELHALVGVRWDLYRGGMRKAMAGKEYWKVERAQELVRAADENCQQLERDFSTDARKYAKCRVSMERYVDRLENVSADYDRQFRVGTRDLMDLLAIENELFEARLKLIDACYSESISVCRLMGVRGSLATWLVGDRIEKSIDTGCREKDDWLADAGSTVPCQSRKIFKNSPSVIRACPVDGSWPSASARKIIRATPVCN